MCSPSKASHILLSGDHSERHELVEADGNSSDDSLCDKYLAQAAELFTSQCMIGILTLPDILLIMPLLLLGFLQCIYFLVFNEIVSYFFLNVYF